MKNFEVSERQQLVNDLKNSIVQNNQSLMNEIATPGAASTKITDDMKDKPDK